ncbi:MAG TPA: nucleoside hydrolase [Candidatus Nanopelagicaceae bacterium]|nr:nucleoside hydrolase [Candidatus Nanopelagicaceae bacterium]
MVVDCDAGVDDALALLYLAGDPTVELVAVGTVDGNVPVGVGAQNCLRALDAAGCDAVPVAVGCDRPLLEPSHYADFHGRDGLGESDLPPSTRPLSPESAVDQLIRLARSRPGELTLLAIGPLTNLAVALMLEPELPVLLREIVVMGGAVACPGNHSPWAEFNVAHDPEAAEMVLRAAWNELTLVGLDATSQAILRPPAVERIAACRSGPARFAIRVLRQQMERRGEFELCDPLAAAICADRSLATRLSTPVQVELRGEHTRAATITDLRSYKTGPASPRPAVSVAMRIDFDRFLANFLTRLGVSS